MRRLLPLVLSLSLLLFPQALAHAQTAAYAEIVAIDANTFPRVSALLDVYNANGAFINDLQASNIVAYEDGTARPVDSLAQLKVPAQIVVAVNPAPALDVRDGSGTSRFERIVTSLDSWANGQPSDSGDDMTLVSLSGPMITDATISDWLVSLKGFKPDFRNSTPNLQTLNSALDNASLPTPQVGMKRAVLFITPAIEDPNIDNSIAPLIKRAVESKVRVFVWFVGAPEDFASPSANAFKSLAIQTSGGFATFSGTETLPDPNLYFEPLRYIYTFSYTSGLNTSGDHSLGLYVETAQGQIPALDKVFNINVQPPNPIFVSPSLEITRQPPADDPYNTEVLTPSEETLRIIVEFPDGHTRDLKRTALYVNGQKVAENTSAPFDQFVWDISSYTQSAQPVIVVEVEDSLGLSKSSIGIPVTLTVKQAPSGIQATFARNSSYLILGAVGVAGLALVAILLFSRAGSGKSRTSKASERKAFEDPLTQPVAALTEPSRSATKKVKTAPRRMAWLPARPAQVEDAPAYLIRLANGGEPAGSTPIAISQKEMTFGTDPVQAVRVLDDLSISALHARIKQTDDGVFTVYDHGSVAGTWVNFETVSREGKRLRHGDRIHFGVLAYRFEQKQAPAESEPRVIEQETAS